MLKNCFGKNKSISCNESNATEYLNLEYESDDSSLPEIVSDFKGDKVKPVKQNQFKESDDLIKEHPKFKDIISENKKKELEDFDISNFFLI